MAGSWGPVYVRPSIYLTEIIQHFSVNVRALPCGGRPPSDVTRPGLSIAFSMRNTADLNSIDVASPLSYHRCYIDAHLRALGRADGYI